MIDKDYKCASSVRVKVGHKDDREVMYRNRDSEIGHMVEVQE